MKTYKKLSITDLGETIKRLPKEEAKKLLRQVREKECYSIVDRAAWFASLTPEQQKEIQAWREAWKNVTDTFIIPQKPDWVS